MKRCALVLALLLVPSFALAVGLGKLTLLSALGQPLRAEIELVSMQKGEVDSLNVGLPSVQVFRQANVEYSGALLSVKFSIGRRGDDRYVVVLSSTQPMQEPFLNLLVELDWAGGRLVREYTLLLDPPEYKGGTKGPAPAIATPTLAPGLTPSPAPLPATAAKPLDASPPAEYRPGIPGEGQSAQPKPAVTYQVKEGDTLAKIALTNKAEGVSLQQMLIALFRGNKDAFDGNNINRMRTGKILNIPDRAAATAVDANEALRSVAAHAADFNEYQRNLGAAVTAAAERDEARLQSASGKITTAVDGKPAPIKAAGDQLKLSKEEEAGRPGAKRSQQGLQEDLLVTEKALKEALERIAILEKNMVDMQKLLELKIQAGAQLQQQAAATDASKTGAPAQAVAAPKAAPKAVAPPPPPELSLVDAMLQNEPVLYGGGALLLALFGAYAYFARKSKKALQISESGGMGGPAVAPDAAMFDPPGGAQIETRRSGTGFSGRGVAAASGTEELDPIAAAGEAGVGSALHEPFGAKIAVAATAIPAEGEAEPAAPHALDFDLGMGAPAATAEAAVAAEETGIASSAATATTAATSAATTVITATTAAAATAAAGATATRTATTAAVQGEIAGTGAASAPEVAADLGFDFDLGADQNKPDAGPAPDLADAGAEGAPNLEALAAALAPALAPAPVEAAGQDDGHAFDFDLKLPSTEEEAKALPLELSAISLELGSPGEAGAPVDARWQEVATKLDLAKAYQEMDDKDGARELLNEVLALGDAAQRQQAQTMLAALG